MKIVLTQVVRPIGQQVIRLNISWSPNYIPYLSRNCLDHSFYIVPCFLYFWYLSYLFFICFCQYFCPSQAILSITFYVSVIPGFLTIFRFRSHLFPTDLCRTILASEDKSNLQFSAGTKEERTICSRTVLARLDVGDKVREGRLAVYTVDPSWARDRWQWCFWYLRRISSLSNNQAQEKLYRQSES